MGHRSESGEDEKQETRRSRKTMKYQGICKNVPSFCYDLRCIMMFSLKNLDNHMIGKKHIKMVKQKNIEMVKQLEDQFKCQ